MSCIASQSNSATGLKLPIDIGGKQKAYSNEYEVQSYDYINQGRSALPLYSTNTALGNLMNWSENWDGAGSAKPDFFAVLNALRLISEWYQLALGSGHRWSPPYVAASEAGEVTFEWWANENKLTIYVGPTDATYIKVWGNNIKDEMFDGAISGNQFLGLWRWLNN